MLKSFLGNGDNTPTLGDAAAAAVVCPWVVEDDVPAAADDVPAAEDDVVELPHPTSTTEAATAASAGTVLRTTSQVPFVVAVTRLSLSPTVSIGLGSAPRDVRVARTTSIPLSASCASVST
jgi:hypothetical protein